MSYKLNNKLKNLVPYEPVQGNYKIRLDANESFYNLSDEMKNKICKSISELDFNRYPDPMSLKPVKAFSELYNIDTDNITAGNGSDELISIISSCFFESGNTIVNVSNDFSMYDFYGHLYELSVKTYKKSEDLTIDADKLISFCKENNADGLIFSNPCNPTGQGLDRDTILKIVSSLPDTLVIVDEAYMDFWNQSVLDKVNDFDNLIILKTCSKAIGMAAVRFGFAVSNKTLTRAFRAAKSPYNNDTVAQTIVYDILSEKDYLVQRKNTIIENTGNLYKQLTDVQNTFGCFEKVYPTCTNFVLIKTEKFNDIYNYLLEKSVAVRKFNGYLRITAGSEEENNTVVSLIKEYFSK